MRLRQTFPTSDETSAAVTTLGRPATADLNLLAELDMLIKELQKTL